MPSENLAADFSLRITAALPLSTRTSVVAVASPSETDRNVPQYGYGAFAMDRSGARHRDHQTESLQRPCMALVETAKQRARRTKRTAAAHSIFNKFRRV